jgi:altronate dehydratase small subunit
MGLKALVIDEADNVANLIGPGNKGQKVNVNIEGKSGVTVIELLDDIPSNHKFAFGDIKPGDTILKYGLNIGTASTPIRKGQHVHAHNIDSNRGRGDLKK